MISVKDANQSPVFIATKDTCLLIVATFALHVERNIGQLFQNTLHLWRHRKWKSRAPCIFNVFFTGGSETFAEKKEHFFQSLREFHKKRARSQTTLIIDRSKLLESVRFFNATLKRWCGKLSYDCIFFQSFRATKHMTAHDWLKNFEIKFVDEEGDCMSSNDFL